MPSRETFAILAGGIGMSPTQRATRRGTLVSAPQEGDISISTVVRATDRALSASMWQAHSSRSGPASPSPGFWTERDLAFRRPARFVGGPSVRILARWEAIGSHPAPMASHRRAAGSRATLRPGRPCARECQSGIFAIPRRQSGALVLRSPVRPASAEAFRYRKMPAPSRRRSVITIAAHLRSGRPYIGGAHCAGSMAATQSRARAAERALEGRSLDDAAISAAAAAATRASARDNAHRQRLLSPESSASISPMLSGLE